MTAGDGVLSKIWRRTAGRVISAEERRLLDEVKRDLLPPAHRSSDHFVPKRQLGSAGYSLRVEEQLRLLRSFRDPVHEALFDRLRGDPEINPGFEGVDYRSRRLIHNGFFPTPDAEMYAAMIALRRPARILEIGSGFSTVVARRAVEHLGLDCEIQVIDPEPRRDIEAFADHVEYARVESSPLADTRLPADTLLFIDSSHVCRSEGDVPFLYCQLLPSLPPGTMVHVHDVFLPYDYPDNYYERFYTEQYLLHALLAGNPRLEVRLAAHYLSRRFPEEMQAVFGVEVGRDPLFFGASFWLETATGSGSDGAPDT